MNYLSNNIELNLHYPNTKYRKVNQKLDTYLKEYLHDFYQTKFIQDDFTYYLNINYTMHEVKDYLSITLFIDTFTGGAHPNYYLETIVFDTKKNEFITIDDLIKKNNNFLLKISNISQDYFLKIPVFKEEVVKKMLLEGTKPIKENFEKFIITTGGIKFFFERYQIAPYVYGAYDITIPFKDLNLSF